MLASLVEHGIGGVRVRALGIDRAGEVRLGRFLHNPRVTPAEMVATSRARSLTRVAGRDVLVIQDTTSLRETVEDSETAAVRAALGWAEAGDLLVLLSHAARARTLAFLDRLTESGWRAGEALPSG